MQTETVLRTKSNRSCVCSSHASFKNDAKTIYYSTQDNIPDLLIGFHINIWWSSVQSKCVGPPFELSEYSSTQSSWKKQFSVSQVMFVTIWQFDFSEKRRSWKGKVPILAAGRLLIRYTRALILHKYLQWILQRGNSRNGSDWISLDL